jgi:hypothetical protein
MGDTRPRARPTAKDYRRSARSWRSAGQRCEFGYNDRIVVVDSLTEDPGIFASNGYAVAAHADGSLVTPTIRLNPIAA